MKNKKDDKFSYALGITLTFELLNFRPKDCVSVYIHSKFTDANSFEKLINLCKEKNITLNKLATNSGLHYSTVFSIFYGKSKSPKVKKIAM